MAATAKVGTSMAKAGTRPEPDSPGTPAGTIVGTAGHIDHGKTSLVRALTGVDLDRLPEEKARGITIALGFTAMTLPGGATVSFVDVPGHERLVRTMIAGATGLDAVLLCVSAVEGVMPQTREHLAILELLGLRQGLIVLTMCDLVDAEMLELATLDVEEAVAGTFLEGAPLLPCAAPAQGEPQGLDALVAALARLQPTLRSSRGPLRLPIDRAFVRRGFGTVVTGTLRSGRVQDGQEVQILPDGQHARVRGVQVHGATRPEGQAGQRVALNLVGVERDDLARGQEVVSPGQLDPASILDARYQHLPSAPALPHGSRVRLLTGTSEVMAVLSVLDRAPDAGPDEAGLRPGGAHWIQLRTDAPLVALPGDRFVLRRESPVSTLGGGEIVDPWAPRARRRDQALAVDQLNRLSQGDRLVLLERAHDAGLSPQRAALLEIQGGQVLGDRVLHPARVAHLVQALEEALATWHAERPLTAGAPRRDLLRGALGHLPPAVFDGLVGLAASQERIELDGPVLRLRGFQVHPRPEEGRILEEMEALARAAGLEGTPVAPLLQRHADAFSLLVARGTLHRVSDRVVHQAALEAMVGTVQAWFREHALLGPAEFKELTGLSRRMAIPLMEWLDLRRVTVREGDHRKAAPQRP